MIYSQPGTKCYEVQGPRVGSDNLATLLLNLTLLLLYCHVPKISAINSWSTILITRAETMKGGPSLINVN